jgi:glycosyltransferase involved in cell wall biosynthesis
LLLISHVTGNPNSHQAAQAFQEAGWLSQCHHTLAWKSLPQWTIKFPRALQIQLNRRLVPHLPPHALHIHPWPEIARLAARSFSIPFVSRWLQRRFPIQEINHRFDLSIARRLPQSPDLTVVYGYFDTSLHTFRAAKRLGLRTIYELPTPYWRTVAEICDVERLRLPAWANSLPSSESLATSAAQRDEEIQLADLVIVPSPFVRDSLSLAPPFQAPVIVLPYGCPEAPSPTLPSPDSSIPSSTFNVHRSAFNVPSQIIASRSPISHLPSSPAKPPLRLLFAGTLSQSKGLADLLEAIIPFGTQVQLTLAGSSSSPSPISHLPSSIRQLGQLPHSELLKQMREHDLFVLPTLYEGLSLALLESLSQGLPVLTTYHSGLDGLINEGKEGFLVPIQSPHAIRNCIEKIISDPSQLAGMASAARDWAAQHSWSQYRQQLRQAVEPLISLS